jgi:hypothetical protein
LPNAYSLVVSPLDGSILVSTFMTMNENCYSLGSYTGIYRSQDGGDTWQKISDKAFFHMAIAPSAPYILYGGGGIFKSIDGGATWDSIANGWVSEPSIYSLAVDPYSADVVYFGTDSMGMFKTTDGGASWMAIGTGIAASQIGAIAIDPNNQRTVYAGGVDWNTTPGTPGVYRSFDNTGLTWEPMMDGMGSRPAYKLVIDRNNVYAGTNSGVWKYTYTSNNAQYGLSIDNGALFTNQITTTLYLTAPGGTTEMMISNDGGFGGAQWEPFANQKQWMISAYGASVIPRTVYGKFKRYGQISGLYQDDIILDQTPPTGSVTISNTVKTQNMNLNYQPEHLNSIAPTFPNAIFLPVLCNNVYPGHRPVLLLLSATDDLSGVEGMLISQVDDFSGAEWQPYKNSMQVFIPDNQVVTLYVKFRDRAGNVSVTYTATTSLVQ